MHGLYAYVCEWWFEKAPTDLNVFDIAARALRGRQVSKGEEILQKAEAMKRGLVSSGCNDDQQSTPSRSSHDYWYRELTSAEITGISCAAAQGRNTPDACLYQAMSSNSIPNPPKPDPNR
jgi:hypothetical protein